MQRTADNSYRYGIIKVRDFARFRLQHLTQPFCPSLLCCLLRHSVPPRWISSSGRISPAPRSAACRREVGPLLLSLCLLVNVGVVAAASWPKTENGPGSADFVSLFHSLARLGL